MPKLIADLINRDALPFTDQMALAHLSPRQASELDTIIRSAIRQYANEAERPIADRDFEEMWWIHSSKPEPWAGLRTATFRKTMNGDEFFIIHNETDRRRMGPRISSDVLEREGWSKVMRIPLPLAAVWKSYQIHLNGAVPRFITGDEVRADMRGPDEQMVRGCSDLPMACALITMHAGWLAAITAMEAAGGRDAVSIHDIPRHKAGEAIAVAPGRWEMTIGPYTYEIVEEQTLRGR